MSESTVLKGGARDEPDPCLTLGHLCSAAVHQLINAFSAIVSQAEALKARAQPDGLPLAEIATRADAVIKAALDGSSLARGLAEFSLRSTAVESSEIVDLSRLAAERIDDHRRRSGPTTEWKFDLASSIRLPGDAAQLGLMLDVLLENARESLPPEGGVIHVAASVDPAGRQVLEIGDDGVGMPDEVREHALEPFFSTKPGRPGLGLALARGVWRRHRGAFSIDSAPGRGTVVRLARPLDPHPRAVEPRRDDAP